MQRIGQRVSYLLLTILGTATLAIAPVAAEHGSSSDGQSGGTSGSQTATTTTTDDHIASTTSSGTTSTQVENENETDSHTTTDVTELRGKAQQQLSTERQGKQEHSVQARQKVCTARQNEIDTRISNLSRNAQKHLDTFNAIFTKVQAFQASKQLKVANYDSLVATATAKQAVAAAAVDSLKSLTVKVDCSSTDPATTLATVKTAANNAKTALQDYRTAIKNIIVALQAGQDSTSTTTTPAGGNQ